jgi:hypothetical protein
MMTELADLYEVITALMAVYKISPEAVRTKQMWRGEQRGTFRKRIRLLETKPVEKQQGKPKPGDSPAQ